MEVGEYVGLLQRDERARTFACLVEKLLLEFVAGKGSFSSFKSLQFPPLPSYFRLLIHATARSFNLRTGSRGFSGERYTVVSLSKDMWLPLLMVNELTQTCNDNMTERSQQYTTRFNTETVRNILLASAASPSLLESPQDGGEQPKGRKRGRGHHSYTKEETENPSVDEKRESENTREGSCEEFVLPPADFESFFEDDKEEQHRKRDRYNSEKVRSNREKDRNCLSHILVLASDGQPSLNLHADLGPECVTIRRCYPDESIYIAIFSTVASAQQALQRVPECRPLGELLKERVSVVGSRMGVQRRPAGMTGDPAVLRQVLKGMGIGKEDMANRENVLRK